MQAQSLNHRNKNTKFYTHAELDEYMLSIQSITGDFNKLMQPILQQFNISYFGVGRYFKDGTSSTLCNDPNSLKFLFQHKDYIPPGIVFEPGLHLWSSSLSNDLLCQLHQKFSHDVGIYLIKDSDDMIETYAINVNSKNSLAISQFINQRHLLNELIAYFKTSASDLIARADCDRALIPAASDKKILSNHVATDSIVETMLQKSYFLTCPSGEIKLSCREMQVLILTLQLHSSKEAAKHLSLSPRTVETHLKNIHNKLNCYSRAMLYEIARNNFLID